MFKLLALLLACAKFGKPLTTPWKALA